MALPRAENVYPSNSDDRDRNKAVIALENKVQLSCEKYFDNLVKEAIDKRLKLYGLGYDNNIDINHIINAKVKSFINNLLV